MRELNQIIFEEITWLHDDDSEFEITDETKEEWKFLGLSNKDFPELFLMDQVRQNKIDRPKTGGSYRIKQGEFKDSTCLNFGNYALISGVSWYVSASHECLTYSLRREKDNLPFDDDVYTVTINEREVLIHISEFYDLSEDEEPNDY
jgi:hypothetical protein